MLTPVPRTPLTPADLLAAPSRAAAAQHREPSLFYAPPYERAAEDETAWHLVKYLDPSCGLLYQQRVVTPAGPAWVDFVVETVGAGGLLRRVGLDVTSAEEARDETLPLRDALLVGAGALDAHYRVPEPALVHRLHDVLAVVAAAEPSLFSTRGHVCLERLAAPETLALAVSPADTRLAVPATAMDESDPFAAIDDEAFAVDRRVGRTPVTWLADYTRALDVLGLALDARTVRRAA